MQAFFRCISFNKVLNTVLMCDFTISGNFFSKIAEQLQIIHMYTYRRSEGNADCLNSFSNCYCFLKIQKEQ